MSNLEPRHPESDLLLQYLDGELSGRKTRQVRRHMEAALETAHPGQTVEVR